MFAHIDYVFGMDYLDTSFIGDPKLGQASSDDGFLTNQNEGDTLGQTRFDSSGNALNNRFGGKIATHGINGNLH